MWSNRNRFVFTVYQLVRRKSNDKGKAKNSGETVRDQIGGIIVKKLLVLLAYLVVLGIAFPQIGEAADDDPIKILCTNCDGGRWATRCKREHPGKEVTCCRTAQERCSERCKGAPDPKRDCKTQCESAWTTCLNNVPNKPPVQDPTRIPTTSSPTELAPEPSSPKRPSTSRPSPLSAPTQVAPK
jgi:hypothetical protein